MTKREIEVIEQVAMVLTKKQDADPDLVFAAAALWAVRKGKVGIEHAEYCTEELKRNC